MYLAGFILALFFSVLLLLKRGKNRQDCWLSLFFMNLCLQFLFLYSDITGFSQGRNYMVLFDIVHWTLIGPLLFLYVRQVIYPNRALRMADLVHLLPLALVLLTYGDYILTRMGNTPFTEYYQAHRGNPTLFIGSMVWGFSCVFYYVLSIVLMYRQRKRMVDF